MEKQLLFLLDWNLNFTTSDLEYHFDSFLAPIRIELQNMELYKRAQREKRRAIENKLEQQRNQLQEQSHYLGYAQVLPVSIPRVHKSGPYSRQGSYSRYPTSSPPSASDVPGLSRSGTEDSIASSYRKTSSNYSSQTPSRSVSQERASLRSVSTTPSSSVSNLSLQQQAEYYAPEPLLDTDSLYDGAIWNTSTNSIEPMILDDYQMIDSMSLQAMPVKQQQKRGMRSFVGYTGEVVKAPVTKKAKMGGFMSRFRTTTDAQKANGTPKAAQIQTFATEANGSVESLNATVFSTTTTPIAFNIDLDATPKQTAAVASPKAPLFCHAITTDDAIQLSPSFCLAASAEFDYAQLAYFESPSSQTPSPEALRSKAKKIRRESSAERTHARKISSEDMAKPGVGMVRRHIAGLAKQALRRTK